MRKKRNKVIIPEGAELMDYLNRGFAICNRCGAVYGDVEKQAVRGWITCLRRLIGLCGK